MGFYALSKEEHLKKVAEIKEAVESDLRTHSIHTIKIYASDPGTHIGKNCYLAMG